MFEHERAKRECQYAKDGLVNSLKRKEILKEQFLAEKGTVEKWTKSVIVISLLLKEQLLLKERLGNSCYENLEIKLETKEKKEKKSRNEKIGINKHNNYMSDRFAPIKICVKCDNVNHLAINWKTFNSSRSNDAFIPNSVTLNTHVPNANRSFTFSPDFVDANMSIPWNMHSENDLFAHYMSNAIYMKCVHNGVNNVPMVQKPTLRVKVDLNTLKPQMEKLVTKSRSATKKDGPKSAWVPKST